MGKTAGLHVQKKDGFVWIKLPDSLNMDNYVKVEQEVSAALTETPPRVVLDLSATASLYSSGLGLLIRLRQRINDEGGVLFLVNVARKISDMLDSVNLERLFTTYATDVEFEISQEDVLSETMTRKSGGFVFVARIEGGLYRINMSGALCTGQDFSALAAFSPEDKVKHYVFDLTGLQMVDTAGIHVLAQLFVSIRDKGGTAVTYGGDEFIRELLDILSLTEFVICCKDEREAMTRVGKA
jgi:anti-anti-sigma factor